MKPDEVTLDTVRRFDLSISQPVHGYRFSLDALLLADFVACSDSARIIDLGTGSGIIPLILCRRFAAAMAVGVDSNRAMAGLARENALRNGLTDRVEIIPHDILDVIKLFPVSSFDGVTANPPFRTPESGKVSPKAGRDTARHESTAGIARFLSAAKYLVKPAGRIWFIYHPDRLAEFIHKAATLNLSLLRLRMVHGTITSPARIFLAELAKSRKGATAVLPPLVIYDEDGSYTPEARLILEEN
jgi:tRNA1Val (adenine37-N6)-methyltransferase